MLLHALLCVIILCAAMPALAQEVTLRVRTDREAGRVDERIYSHFLEHIFRSVNGGLWGEQVWNRSFESLLDDRGYWSTAQGELRQATMAQNARFLFGDPTWTDYEFRAEAMKTGGLEGFLVIVRADEQGAFYWANLGGWSNQAHQLEHEAAPGRRRPVGPRPAGRIEANRWYALRVRCEGPRLQVWIDDQLVLDFTDGPGATLRGRIGLGTWHTTARFRNLRVSALDGRELWSGLPDTQVAAHVPTIDHWTPLGEGAVAATAEDPLNGRIGVSMNAARGPAGVRQRAIRAVRGDTISGSIWVRGAAPQGLRVRLADEAGVVAEAAVLAPTAEWREYTVRLRPSRTARDAVLEVWLAEGAAVIDQLSLMPASARRVGGFRPDLLQAVAALRPPTIRWPGGIYAEHYRWKDGIGPQHQRGRFPIRLWDDEDVNSLGTHEFIDLCRRVGAEPVIVVNGGRHDPSMTMEDYIREACEWVEYCNGPVTSRWGAVRAANGHPEPFGVKYWEICNEAWAYGAEPYARRANAFIEAMKRVDPTIRIIVCGGAGTHNAFGGNWNQVVITGSAPRFDYLSIHHYEDPNRFAEGPLDYERHFVEIAEMFARSANPNAHLFVSEWNAQSTDWRTGLYAGGILNAFERQGAVVTMASPALFLRHVSATDWDNAFINFDHNRWFPAPNYVVMKLWRDHFAPVRLDVEGDARGLSVVATATERRDRVILKLVNPTRSEVRLAAETPGARRATMWRVAPGELSARNTLERPDAVRTERAQAVVRDGRVHVTLPPISVAVVSVTTR